MDELRFNGTGTDASYLANVNMFFTALFTAEIFRNNWPEGKLGSQDSLNTGVDWYRQMFEGGLTGNRFHIASRKAARKDLDTKIQKILFYVAVMAEDADVSLLLSSGVVTKKSQKRVRKTLKPVVAKQSQ